MAEAEDPKTLTLAQQWVLQENARQQEEQGETPAEARQTTEEETPANADVEEPVTDKTVEESSAVEEPVIEKINEEASAAEETVAENSDESSASEGSTDVADNKESEEQETVEEKSSVKIETAPVDFRFPTTNQTRHCFTRYVEYHRCVAAKGEDASECDKFAKYYRSLCPGEWIDRWNEQRENGTFPGPL